MQKCTTCEIEKDSKDMSKKHFGLCKRCTKRISEKKYKLSEKGKLSEKRRRLKRKESGYLLNLYRNNEKYRKASLARNKRRAIVSPEKVKEELKRSNLRNREKYLARQDLRRAVFRGKIIKPQNCQKCGILSDRIEGHHEDYSKRLEVMWLCVECHKRIHGKIS